MSTSLQVLLWLSLALCCWSVPANEKAGSYSKTSTLKTPLSSPKTVGSNKDTSVQKDSDESEESGISHIIKHSKLFTEFVSFAVNPVKSMELVDSVKSGILADQPSLYGALRESHENETSQNNTSTESSTGWIQSSAVLRELFVEMTKSNSPGFIVSFDYLNITSKSSDGDTMFRKPVRMWGILPDEQNNKTVYFLADYYLSTSYDAEIKDSAKEQIEDFESWKNETLSSGEFTDDKLGDGTIGSLLGG